MKTLTILEGPDGGGKTTLAGELQGEVWHGGTFKGEDRIAQFYLAAMGPAWLRQHSVIMDRSWLSEPIYGEVFRNSVNRIRPKELKKLEQIATSCNGIVVLCLPPMEVARKNFVKRLREGREYLVDEVAWERVYHLYENLESALPVVRYDYTKPNDYFLSMRRKK